jgi:hypothetical protein
MTYEEALKIEQNLHLKYFLPFDQLLDKKAEYYLKQVEDGKENDYLLKEIEIMDKFREYVVILESIAQEHLTKTYLVVKELEQYKKAYMRELEHGLEINELLGITLNQL